MNVILVLFFSFFSIQAEVSQLINGCNSGKATDCFEYAYRRAVDGDQLAPLTYFEKGCNLKDGRSCYALDRVYKKLNQLIGDPKYLVLSCEHSFGMGCFKLADFYFIKKDYLQSLDHYEKACSLNVKKACEKKDQYDIYFSKIIRTNSKELNKEELADQKRYLDLLKARMKVLEKSCTEKKYERCTELASKYLFLANLIEARKWAETACNNKSAEGCLALGEVEQKEGKLDLTSFEKACDLELAMGCIRYAQSIEKKNLARSMSFYRRACQVKIDPSAESCLKYSIYQKANPKLAKKYKELACKLDKVICNN